MKRTLTTLIALIAIFALVVPTLPTAQAAVDEGLDVLSSCPGGQCAIPKSAGSVVGAKGPAQTVPRGAPYNVNIVNPYVGVGSPALNSISGSTAGQLGQSYFEWAQTFVLEALKKRVLDLMVDEIINWVQGGDSPKFITDWQSFLGDAGNVAAGEFANKLAQTDLCAPIKARLTVPFSKTGSGSGFDGRNTPVSCTLDKIVKNIEDFQNDFANGGWVAYQESWAPQNNIFGAYILTRAAQVGNIEAAQNAATLEGLSGGGFLSTKSCTENPASDGPDLDGDKKKGDIASTCKITTPGSVIGDLVGKAVGADIDFIVNADQLATYVAAISDALFNRLIRDGVAGLQGLTTSHAPGDGYISNNPDECLALNSTELINACINYRDSNNNNFGVTKDNLLADIQVVKGELVTLKNALIEWKTVADGLNEFIIEKSAEKSATCISDALKRYFSNPTPQGVANLAASINAQLQTVETRITTLDTDTVQLNGLTTTTTWAQFTVIASAVQSHLASYQPAENATEQVLAQKGELETAAMFDIKPAVSFCR